MELDISDRASGNKVINQAGWEPTTTNVVNITLVDADFRRLNPRTPKERDFSVFLRPSVNAFLQGRRPAGGQLYPRGTYNR